MPCAGTTVSVTGVLHRTAVLGIGEQPVKRIPMEVKEIVFLASDAPAQPAPVKGESLFHVYAVFS
jgi:hypothetical protein